MKTCQNSISKKFLENLTKDQKKEFLTKLSTGNYYLRIEDFTQKKLHFNKILDSILIPKNSVILTVSDNGDFIDDLGSIYLYEKIIKDEPGRVFLDEKAAKKYIECLEKSC